MNIVQMITALESISNANVTFVKNSWNTTWHYSVQGSHSGNTVSFSGNKDTFEEAVSTAYETLNKLTGAVPTAFGILAPPTAAEVQHLDEEITKEPVTEADDWL
jgi:hypothetical protein